MIKIKRGVDNQFYFVVIAKNGQVLVTSETYKQKVKALQSAEALIELFSGAEPVEVGDFSMDFRTRNGLERKQDETLEDNK